MSLWRIGKYLAGFFVPMFGFLPRHGFRKQIGSCAKNQRGKEEAGHALSAPDVGGMVTKRGCKL